MNPLLGFLLMQLGGSIASMWVDQPVGTTIDFRNVKAIDTQVAWASGSHGTYARTIDGGKTWHARPIPAASRCDFWVHALSVDSAMLVSGVPPARVYRTTNGGRSWNLQYEDLTQGMRLNGGAFWSASRGVIWGDPVNGGFVVLTTTDGGGVWLKTTASRIPKPLPGEGGLRHGAFATDGEGNAWFGTGGGALARIFRTTDGGDSWTVTPTRLTAGTGGGVSSIAFRDAMNGVALGGSASESAGELSRSANGGATWSLPSRIRPEGLESMVFVPRTSPATLVGVGRGGSVFSTDGGVSWTAMGKDPFDAVSFAGPVDAGWAVAASGRIAKYVSGVSRSRSLRGSENTTRILTEPAAQKPTLGRVAPAPTEGQGKASPTKPAHPALELSN